MTLSLVWHAAHNAILVVCYTTLASLLFNLVHRRLFPALNGVEKIFARYGAFLFFVGCAWDHLEEILHLDEVPSDYLSLSHLSVGTLQAAGASAVAILLLRELRLENQYIPDDVAPE